MVHYYLVDASHLKVPLNKLQITIFAHIPEHTHSHWLWKAFVLYFFSSLNVLIVHLTIACILHSLSYLLCTYFTSFAQRSIFRTTSKCSSADFEHLKNFCYLTYTLSLMHMLFSLSPAHSCTKYKYFWRSDVCTHGRETMISDVMSISWTYVCERGRPRALESVFTKWNGYNPIRYLTRI